ncbi:hypothetical protein HYW46_00470 [Candidatus Daviesbacteria bacterium]|nr:hypothetical protein [Candidatus Daviesbacteria bacterium]
MPKSPEQDLGSALLTFTYNDLFDGENYSQAMARYGELHYKQGPLTPEEKIEMDNLYVPLFRHFFDPI